MHLPRPLLPLLCLSYLFSPLFILPVLGQIIPDDTLGGERSQVTPNGDRNGLPTEVIDGGALRGSNLFHSFSDFNVDEGRGAYFTNPDGVGNIFSRVTGANPSDIFGTLGVDGPANLFLLDPNGILFGPNAILDIEGSFMGSAAGSVIFADGTEFSAVDTIASPQLTISVPLGLQLGGNPIGNIENDANLSVGPAQNLTLMANRIEHRGSLLANDGDITLMAGAPSRNQVAEDVFALVQGNVISIGGDIQIHSQGNVLIDGVFVAILEGGAIDINAIEQITLENDALIAIFLNGDNSGNLTLEANDIEINDAFVSSFRRNDFSQGGNIHITATDTLSIRQGSFIGSDTESAGDAGDILIEATVIEMEGFNQNGGLNSEGSSNAIASLTNEQATGNAGDITITAQQLTMRDGGVINSLADGGDAGDVLIDVAVVELIGVNPSGGRTTVGTSTRREAVGMAGNIQIVAAERLALRDGALITTFTINTQDAGDISIKAGLVEIIGSGETAIGVVPSAINSGVEDTESTGNGGMISIQAQQLSLQEGGRIESSTRGDGTGGNILIEADVIELVGEDPIGGRRSFIATDVEIDQDTGAGGNGRGGNIVIQNASRLSIRDGAELSASTLGAGDTGTIAIDTDFIEVLGVNSTGNPSSISVQIDSGTGNAQSLTIDTKHLVVEDGAQIRAITADAGNGGDLRIDADILELTGVNPIDAPTTSSTISASSAGSGSGGNIQITSSERISIKDGAQISAVAFANGDSGAITIEASLVEVIGNDVRSEANSSISNQVSSGATGNAENVTVDARQIVLKDGGQIGSATFGNGNAGVLTVRADRIDLVGTDGLEPGRGSSGFFVSVQEGAVGNGGNIAVTVGDRLTILDGATISASTSGDGDAGTLNISAHQIEVSGRGSEGDASAIAAQVNPEAVGDAQTVTINAQQLLIQDGGIISSETTGQGKAGDLFINVSDIQLVGSDTQIVAQTTTDFQAGTIDIQPTAGQEDVAIAFQDGATISAETSGNQTGGDILLTAPEAITLTGDGSISARSTGEADAGSLTITTNQLTLTDGIDATVSSVGNANSGTLTIQTQTLALDTQAQLIAETDSGIGGNIDLEVTDTLTLNNGSRISASTQDGQGGTLTINGDRPPTRSVSLSQNSALQTQATGTGDSGNLSINANQLNIDNSSISASTLFGIGGTVTLTGLDTLQLNQSNLSTTTQDGQGGNITIDTTTATLSNRSTIDASTAGSGDAGNIVLTAQDSLTIQSNSALSSSTIGAGNAGNLDLVTPQLTLQDKGQVTASTTATGRPGSITIQDAETVSLINQSTISTALEPGATVAFSAQPGNINIQTQSLSLQENSEITASTAGQGNAGTITVPNAERVSLTNSAIATTVEATGIGQGGNIDIETNTLELGDRARIASSTAGQGNAGQIEVDTDILTVGNRSQITTSTAGRGDAGRIEINATDAIALRNNSQITTAVNASAVGNADRIILQTPDLSLRGTSTISAATNSTGNAGIIRVLEADTISLNNSAISTSVGQNAIAQEPGNINLQTGRLVLNNNASITATTAGQGSAGQIQIQAVDRVALDASDIATEVERNAEPTQPGTIEIGTRSLQLANDASITASTAGNGNAGAITLNVGELYLSDRAQITSQSTFEPQSAQGNPGRRAISSRVDDAFEANAGDITIMVEDELLLQDSDISTQSTAFAGGEIEITANTIQLRGDGDIRTNVASGVDDGGDITLTANAIIAFDDSDIISSAQGGAGGNITLNTPAFLGENLQVNAPGETDFNDRVDLNATGSVSGAIITPDVSFIQNSLNTLADDVIDTEAAIANSCVARSDDNRSTFLITGNEGLPERPGRLASATYVTGEVQGISPEVGIESPLWQPGQPIIEAEGVYQLPNGDVIISHRCTEDQ